MLSQEDKNKNETTTLATTNKKYEKITYIPKNKENLVLNNKNYLKEFDFSYTEMNITNNNFTEKMNESKTKSKNEDIDEDIDEFYSNTDYYQLAHQIAESIKELKNNFNISDKKNNFETVLKNIGKTADIICFNDVIGCIKKISDINSEINLIKKIIQLILLISLMKKKLLKFLILME